MQPNLSAKKTYKASWVKVGLLGFTSIFFTIVMLALIVLMITGIFVPDNFFFTMVRFFIGAFFLFLTWTYFIASLDSLTIDGTTLTLKTGGFKKKVHTFNIATIRSVEADRSGISSASYKKPYDMLLFTGENPNEKFSLNIAFINKQGRHEILQIFAPIILREDATRPEDRQNIQKVISRWDTEAPLQLTPDAQALARKAKKLNRILYIIVGVCALPLILLFVILLPLALFFISYDCDRLLNSGVTTTARIVSVKADTGARTPDKISNVKLALVFEANGKQYNETHYVSYNAPEKNKAYYDKIKNAKTVDIKYLPNDPRTFDIAENFKDGTATLCKE